MVAMPELDGATGSIVFGGRSDAPDGAWHGATWGCVPSSEAATCRCIERAGMLAARVTGWSRYGGRAAERKIAVVLFNFPPNAGSAGTAAYLAVFDSLPGTLDAMKAEATRRRAARPSMPCASASSTATPDASARLPMCMRASRPTTTCAASRWLARSRRQWGPAPGKHQSDGASIFVLGAQFGNVFVGVQPAFGYEGDPMRLLFEKGFAPTHAFSAFYRWLREDFGADAVLHFGTHGALEFMPGKQAGLVAASAGRTA